MNGRYYVKLIVNFLAAWIAGFQSCVIAWNNSNATGEMPVKMFIIFALSPALLYIGGHLDRTPQTKDEENVVKNAIAQAKVIGADAAGELLAKGIKKAAS